MKTPPLLILPLFGLLLCVSCEKHEAPPHSSESSSEAPAAPDPKPPLQPAAPSLAPDSPKAKAPAAVAKTVLFNGKDLGGWKSVNFGGEGEVAVEDGEIRLDMGETLTAIVYHGKAELPTMGYEISLEANKLMGNDFFCGLTFPVRDSHATLIVGGWGGAVVGISSIDDFDASENETAQFMAFDENRWYRIRLRVVEERLMVWIDDRKMIDFPIQGREVDMRPGEIELCIPLGIASYQTRSAFRNIVLKRL